MRPPTPTVVLLALQTAFPLALIRRWWAHGPFAVRRTRDSSRPATHPNASRESLLRPLPAAATTPPTFWTPTSETLCCCPIALWTGGPPRRTWAARARAGAVRLL